MAMDSHNCHQTILTSSNNEIINIKCALIVRFLRKMIKDMVVGWSSKSGQLIINNLFSLKISDLYVICTHSYKWIYKNEVPLK